MQIILLYGIEIAKGFLPNFSTELPIFLNGMQLIAALIAIRLMEIFKRRFLMVKMTAFLSISLLGLCFGFILKDSHPLLSDVMVCVCFCLTVFSFVFSVITMPWIYIPEVVQPGFIPIFFSIIWFMGALVTLIFPLIR